ncbi:unnamed protein product [Moneuplotes crassus]|uniref:Uncharacterized protein n=1 Tax=Euplotes crassus TaxID=5936 RepID=A0AAD1XNX1_EUPCR|nr:unnamed protein product [Moneuplotes crassus]
MIFEWVITCFIVYLLVLFYSGYHQITAKIPDFSGRVVLITGASSGIGEQLAKDLNRNGADVIITARRVEVLNQVKQECVFPDKVHVVRMDLSNIEELTQIAKDLNNKFKIDILINNGGVGMRGKFKNLQLKVVKQIMNANFLSACTLTRYIGEGMVSRKSGHIINNGSVAGLFPLPLRSIYSASKYAMRVFSNSIKAELKDSGITVTDIFPGYVQTDISANSLSGNGIPFGKTDENTTQGMKVEEVSKILLYYCRQNEKRQKDKWMLLKSLIVDPSRIVVCEFYVKVAVILSSLSEYIYRLVSNIKYNSQLEVMSKVK